MTATVAAATTGTTTAAAAKHDSIQVYPVKEEEREGESSNNEYKVALDITYRRTNVLRLSAQYLSEREIADRLQISPSTIHRDLVFLRTQTRQNLAYYLYYDFPLRFRKCITGLEGIINVMSEIMEDPKRTADERMKAAMIKSDTILKLIHLTDNADAPAVRAAHNYLARQKAELERNKDGIATAYSMSKKERREQDEEESFVNAVSQSAEEAVEKIAIQNEETRPMF
jgi:IS30 family transposase